MNTYKDEINNICKRIHTGLIDFSEPRCVATIPTQASSEFITNKQQGDWAEDVILRAVNENSERIVAVKYGKSDDIVAGDEGFEDFFIAYQAELDTIGKRPDILLFKKEDFDTSLGYDISRFSGNRIDSYVRKAIVGIEVRSSAFLINKYNSEANRVIEENTAEVIRIRDIVVSDYMDLLEQKRPELIPLLLQLDAVSVRSIDYRVPTWHSSLRLQELSSHLSAMKKCLKTIQKRNSLSITPKVEDLKVVHKWIMTYDVPHFYAQVFFDKIYGISFKQIMELVSDPNKEDEKYFIEQDSKNQNKTTIKIPAQDCICLAQTVSEPYHTSVRKELNKGRLLFYVKFDGGQAILDNREFEELFGYSL